MSQSINVLQFAEARASEIASLMNEVNSSERCKKKTWFQKLPHHMRRRGASQNPKRVPKNLRGDNKNSTAKATSKAKHKKKPKDIQEEYAKRSMPDKIWLETHIWHAKRFKMENMWGYSLPIHSNDRKLGLSHKTAAHHAMLQDLSYYCCIELEGVREVLSEQLSLLTDSSAGHTFSSEMFLSGSKEGHCFLYHPNSCPYGAIGPVSFLWRPLSPNANEIDLRIPTTQHKLWIWCHPSIHNELVEVLVNIFNFKELIDKVLKVEEVKTETEDIKCNKSDKIIEADNFKFACKLNFSKTQHHFCKEKRYYHKNTKMVLRKDTLTRHRLIGPKSPTVLYHVLKLANITDSSTEKCTENGSCRKKIKTEPNSKESWGESYFNRQDMKVLYEEKDEFLGCLKDVQSSYFIMPRSIIGLTVRDPRLLESNWKNNTEDGSLEDEDYSDISELLTPEMADSDLWDEDIRNQVTAAKLPDREINEGRSKSISGIDLGKEENKVPILIVHQRGFNGFGAGWDIIAPQGWSLEFWRSFERKGGRPAGLRDIQFINLESGGPSFPGSFPDTKAGSTHEEKQRLEALKKHLRHPKSKRPNFSIFGVPTPFFASWKTLVDEWEKELSNQNSKTKCLFTGCESLVRSKRSSLDNLQKTGFFVLRNALLWKLHDLSRKMNHYPMIEISEADNFRKIFTDILLSVTCDMEIPRSLVLIKIQCLNKGRPSTHSGIYLLNDLDFEEIKRNYKFPGPDESKHSKSNSDSKSLVRQEVQSVISCSSRQLIGYVTEGGFNSVCGQGFAIGHCVSIGFLTMIWKCIDEGVRPLVLVREQNSFKYRIATIEIIENYLL